jgi:DNA-directed RNA polymerase specialized sigma subunit
LERTDTARRKDEMTLEMTTTNQLSELEHHRERRCQQARNRRMLNNLPLAHRLAAGRAADPRHEEYLLGQAMVGLVEAVDSFEQIETNARFGAFAEPHITSALDRSRDEAEVEVAQAEIAEAISSQERVQELADFLDVPAEALVGGLMDAAARERVFNRHRPVRGAA